MWRTMGTSGPWEPCCGTCAPTAGTLQVGHTPVTRFYSVVVIIITCSDTAGWSHIGDTLVFSGGYITHIGDTLVFSGGYITHIGDALVFSGGYITHISDTLVFSGGYITCSDTAGWSHISDTLVFSGGYNYNMFRHCRLVTHR